MPSGEVKYQRCADIALEAERMIERGETAAARVLHRRVAETCVFGPSPCPNNSECRTVIARVGEKLGALD